MSLLKSQDSHRTSPIVSQLASYASFSPAAAHHTGHSGSERVLYREEFLCLPDRTDSTWADHVCCLRTLVGGGTQVPKEEPNATDNLRTVAPIFSSEVGINQIKTANFTTCTNDMSSINEEYLRYAQDRGPNASKSLLLRTPGTPIFCTLLNLRQHSIRLCHSQSSSKDSSVKPKQCDSEQTELGSNTNLGETSQAQLTHTDAQGRATMVDVGGKAPTRRTATACATVILGPTAFQLLRDNQLAKGDAMTVAQLAGIMASKQTSALIPLCHPLPLDHTSVTFDLDELHNAVDVTATCRTTGRTGVEMEALTAVSVAALTVYDMCKAVSHDIIITDVKLVSKTGGKRDFNRHPQSPRPIVNPVQEN